MMLDEMKKDLVSGVRIVMQLFDWFKESSKITQFIAEEMTKVYEQQLSFKISLWKMCEIELILLWARHLIFLSCVRASNEKFVWEHE